MKYTRYMLEPIVAESVSISEVLRKLGKRQAGSIITHLGKVIKKLEINTSHFLGQAANSGTRCERTNKKSFKDVLKLNTKNKREDAWRLRRALVESGRHYACEVCGLTEWRGKPLNLQVDHKDGDWQNNTESNLRFICPNCHSQTPNHSGSLGLTDLTSNARYQREYYRRKRGCGVTVAAAV